MLMVKKGLGEVLVKLRMKIIRVFPRKTSMTPSDPLSFVGDPPLNVFRPDADEVHISCTFMWDIPEASRITHVGPEQG